MQGPESFLQQLRVELPCPVDPSRTAELAPALRSVVNGHFFWVADPVNLEAFRADPARFTGSLLDPTLHEWFTPSAGSPRLDLENEILLFASRETRDSFNPTPARPPSGELDFLAEARAALPTWARHVH